MDKLVGDAKNVIRSVVPSKLLDAIWARYLQAKSKHELTVAKSLVTSPKELDAIHRQHLSSNNESNFLTIEWLRKRISQVQDPALRSYFAITADDITPSLCAPSHCYRALINSVIAVSVQSNLRIGYGSNGDVVYISNYAQLVRDLQSKSNVRLHLSSLESEFEFYLERWEVEDGVLTAPRANPVTRKIYLESPSAKAFLETPGRNLKELYPTPLLEECTFDVDVVYTWVDFNDPEWQKMLESHTESPVETVSDNDDDDDIADEDVDKDRFLSRDELKYSLRSLLQFAPWVRQVFVVTNCKPPHWFDETNDRVRWIYHEDIIEPQHLPTFSSHAIEASIHRVPGLSERFLYFNDDLFLLKPVEKSDFFLANGIAKIRPEPYGMVHGELDEDDPDYLNAARNVQALLQREFGKTATKLHTHSPQSALLSVIQACEQTFFESYENTRGNKFRSSTDISPTSFMYPSFAYLTGNAVMDYPNVSLVNVTKPFRKLFGSYLAAMNSAKYSELPLTLCINDGGGSAQDEEWGMAVVNFMSSAFDQISDAERAYGSGII